MVKKTNKIYRVVNKARNAIIVVAETSSEASAIAVKLRFAKKSKNVKTEDITFNYLQNHKKLKEVPEQKGQLFKCIDGEIESWGVYFIN